MKRGMSVGAVLVLILTSLACGLPSAASPAATPTAQAISEATTGPVLTATSEPGSPAEDASAEPAQEVSAAATNTPAPQDCGFDAAFVGDLNVPDGTLFEPNTGFDKSWRLKNTGCALWPAGLQVVFASGHQVGGPSSAPLPVAVEPGAEVDITLAFTAPAEPGSYLGNYQLHDPQGAPFGPTFYVSIIVPAGGGGQPQGPGGIQANPTSTPLHVIPGVIAVLPTATPTLGIFVAPTCTYSFALVEHITPNGQTVFSGQYFEKKWRFQNTGTCKFPNGTQFYFISGDQMGAPTSGSLTAAQLVGPNETFIFTLTGYGPQTKGFRSSSWGFRDHNGNKFGITFTMEVNVQ